MIKLEPTGLGVALNRPNWRDKLKNQEATLIVDDEEMYIDFLPTIVDQARQINAFDSNQTMIISEHSCDSYIS